MQKCQCNVGTVGTADQTPHLFNVLYGLFSAARHHPQRFEKKKKKSLLLPHSLQSAKEYECFPILILNANFRQVQNQYFECEIVLCLLLKNYSFPQINLKILLNIIQNLFKIKRFFQLSSFGDTFSVAIPLMFSWCYIILVIDDTLSDFLPTSEGIYKKAPRSGNRGKSNSVFF